MVLGVVALVVVFAAVYVFAASTTRREPKSVLRILSDDPGEKPGQKKDGR